jgi:hypothetical protein
MTNPFVPQSLICRDAELAQVCALLKQDQDLVVTGVPGVGRRTLIRSADPPDRFPIFRDRLSAVP